MAIRSKINSNSSFLGQKKTDNTTFEYFAPEAKEVQLAGSFNNWDSSETPLKKDKTGKWKVALSLAPGRYEYRYLVDGQWQNEQRPCTYVRNSFGSTNCVIEVGEKTF